MRTLKAFGQEVFSLVSIPSVRPLLAENVGNLCHYRLVDDFLTAILTIYNRNRNAPFSLTGNTPIGTLNNH